MLRNLKLHSKETKAELKIRVEEAIADFSSEDLFRIISNNSEAEDHYQKWTSYPTKEEEKAHKEEVSRLRICKKKENIMKLKQHNKNSNCYNFRDIEDSVPEFSGDDNFPIQRWIVQFEECSIVEMDNKTKFIFGKRLFTGTARLFLRTINYKNWNELKVALTNDFRKVLTKSDIYEILRNRKR